MASAAVLVMGAGGRIAPTSVSSAQWALRAAQAERVWQVSTGAGVTVAVIDSGVDAKHPDLQGRVERGADYGDGSSGDGTQDSATPRGHGTQVASLIAGTGANYTGNGLLGLAPDAKILPFGIYRNGNADPAAAAEAIRAATGRGAKVMVVAPVGSQANASLDSAVQQAIQRDVIVVSGVGNGTTGNGPAFPAAIPGVVAVTAVDRNGHVWAQAERGPSVVLAAPGVGMLTAATDGSYWTGDDTAYAAAWVAGAAALLRSAHPDWSAAQVEQEMVTTAQPEGGGRNPDYGFGVLDPLRALTDPAVPHVTRNPLLPPVAAPQVASSAHARPAPHGSSVAPLAIALAVVLLLGGGAAVLAGRRQVGTHRERGAPPSSAVGKARPLR